MYGRLIAAVSNAERFLSRGVKEIYNYVYNIIDLVKYIVRKLNRYIYKLRYINRLYKFILVICLRVSKVIRLFIVYSLFEESK